MTSQTLQIFRFPSQSAGFLFEPETGEMHNSHTEGTWFLSFANISALLKKKKLSRQICLNIWLMMFISPTGHRGLISSLATWWPISSYSGWEEGDGWGYNHPLLRHILLSYSGAQKKKPQTHKKISRSQHMLKHIITMLMGQVNT